MSKIAKYSFRRCTLRTGLHKIPTMIDTFLCGLENTHACKWISDNFPGITHISAFLESCQKSICMYCCSPIQGRRSLRVSNPGDKSGQYMELRQIVKNAAYVLFLENCQKSFCIHGCSPTQEERSYLNEPQIVTCVNAY